MSYEYVDFGEQRDYKAERDTLKDDVLAWAVTCNNLEQENKKLKAERDKFEKMLNKECECGYKLEGQLHDMTKQRDTLSDDLSWYKAKVSRLEEIREIKDSALKGADIKVKTLEQRHSKLVDENTRLQNELYTMGLNQDEADDKTKKLERENEELKESHIKHIADMENYYKDRVQELKEENKDKNRIISKRLEHENKENIQWYQMHKECADAVYNKKMMYESLLSEISQHIGNKPSSSTYKYFRGKLNALEIREGE